MARIFISHSCKDLNDLPADGAKAERLQFARWVREKLESGLKGNGHTAWIDKKYLEPGDDWCAKLHYWLGACDGAIVLLDGDSAASEWVKKEATILAWRWSQRPSLKLVPVFMGGFKSGDLRPFGFGAIRLETLEVARLPETQHALTEVNADRLAQKIVESFGEATERGTLSPLDRWALLVQGCLSTDDEATRKLLEDVAIKVLAVTGDDLAQSNVPEILAYHLLMQEEPERVLEALDALSKIGLGREKVERLAGLLRPLWIEAPHGRDFSTLAGSHRVIAVNAEHLETAEELVERATHCEVAKPRLVRFAPNLGIGGVDEAWNVLEQTIRDAARHPGRDLKKFLDKRVDYLLVGGDAVRDDFLKKLEEQSKTISVCIGGSDFGRLTATSTASRLAPGFANDDEDAGREFVGEVNTYYKNT